MSGSEVQGPVTTDEQLVDSIRRVVRSSRISMVAPDELRRAQALIEQAAQILEQRSFDGAMWQTGLTDISQFVIEGTPREMFGFSPALGARNPLSPPMTLELDGDALVGTVTFTEPYGGPPWDTCHGGIVALVYDDIIGMAAMFGAGGGLTARLTVNYRKPVPLHREISVRAWFESHEGRKFVARGEMRLDGELLNEADGLFVQPRGFGDVAV